MVFNWKIIIVFIITVILLILSIMTVNSLYQALKETEYKLEQAINAKKQLTEAFLAEQQEQKKLNAYKISQIKKLNEVLKNDACYNSAVPDVVIDSLYNKK